jgi:hypothetical protein
MRYLGCGNALTVSQFLEQRQAIVEEFKRPDIIILSQRD